MTHCSPIICLCSSVSVQDGASILFLLKATFWFFRHSKQFQMCAELWFWTLRHQAVRSEITDWQTNNRSSHLHWPRTLSHIRTESAQMNSFTWSQWCVSTFVTPARERKPARTKPPVYVHKLQRKCELVCHSGVSRRTTLTRATGSRTLGKPLRTYLEFRITDERRHYTFIFASCHRVSVTGCRMVCVCMSVVLQSYSFRVRNKYYNP